MIDYFPELVTNLRMLGGDGRRTKRDHLGNSVGPLTSDCADCRLYIFGYLLIIREYRNF